MRNIAIGSIVFVSKQRTSRKFVRVEGRTGTAIRVVPRSSGEPDVLVDFDQCGVDDRSREWCWRDELEVVM